MVWEIAVAVNCLIPLVYWICIDRRYTVMMQRLDKVAISIEKHMVGHGIDNNSSEWVSYCDRLHTIESLKGIGKKCRHMGRCGLWTCALPVVGAVIIGFIVTNPDIKWLVFLVCASPIHNIVSHFRDLFRDFMSTASLVTDRSPILAWR